MCQAPGGCPYTRAEHFPWCLGWSIASGSGSCSPSPPRPGSRTHGSAGQRTACCRSRISLRHRLGQENEEESALTSSVSTQTGRQVRGVNHLLVFRHREKQRRSHSAVFHVTWSGLSNKPWKPQAELRSNTTARNYRLHSRSAHMHISTGQGGGVGMFKGMGGVLKTFCNLIIDWSTFFYYIKFCVSWMFFKVLMFILIKRLELGFSMHTRYWYFNHKHKL